MNAGRDYRKARRQAQANADRTQTPRFLHAYGGTWWIEKTPVDYPNNPMATGPSERIDPKPRKEHHA